MEIEIEATTTITSYLRIRIRSRVSSGETKVCKYSTILCLVSRILFDLRHIPTWLLVTVRRSSVNVRCEMCAADMGFPPDQNHTKPSPLVASSVLIRPWLSLFKCIHRHLRKSRYSQTVLYQLIWIHEHHTESSVGWRLTGYPKTFSPVFRTERLLVEAKVDLTCEKSA
jgi:hypothetical protein